MVILGGIFCRLGMRLVLLFVDSCYKPVSNTHVQPFQEIYVPKILKLK